MRMLLVTCLLAAAAVTHISGQTTVGPSNDTSAQGDKVFLKVLGHSGKIIIAWQKDIQGDDRRVEIDFDGLQELDNTLKPVKHSFTTFASQDFKFSQLQQGTIGTTSSKASFFTFSSRLKGLNTTITITIYILGQDGSITLDGETTPVNKDDIKVNIQIDSWSWCSTATSNKNCDADGAYIDLTLAVRSRGVPQKKAKNNSTGDADAYSLGYGTFLLSKKVQLDGGSWQNMAANYPQFQTRGDRQIFTFRFPKFTRSVLYDPTVSGSTAGDNAIGGSGHLAGTTLLLILAATLSKTLGY